MHLAQLNIAKARAPLDDPRMAEFVENLEPVNTLADNSPGFIWRLQDDSGDATSINAFDDPAIIVNMSVWDSVESLKQFLFKTHHLLFLKRKTEWFEKLPVASHVLWWIDAGHTPSLDEAKARLLYLRENGESAYAFGINGQCLPSVHPSSQEMAN
jgi:hypothetical protein